MKTYKYLFLLLLSSLFLIIGCNNTIKYSDNGYVKIGISITDFQNPKESRLVAIPEDYSESDYFITVFGVLNNEFANDEQNRTTFGGEEKIPYNELNSLSYTIQTGEWNVFVNAYVTYNGEEKLISKSNKVQNITSETNVLSFTLEPVSGSDLQGSFDVNINFVKDKIQKVKISYYKSFDDLLSQIDSIREDVLSSSEFTTGSINLGFETSPGYYYLKLDFYNDTELLNLFASRIIVVKVIAFYKSVGTYNYEDFSKLNVFKVSFKDAGGRDFTGDSEAIFIEENDVGTFSLPSSVVSTLNSVTNPVVFEGWFSDENCSSANKIDAPVTKNSIIEDTVYYAKWSYKDVYIDSANSSASDTNFGNTNLSPFKSVDCAKLYLGSNSENLYIISTISGAEEVEKLSDISISAHNNAVVKRYDSLITEPLVSLGQNDIVSLQNVTFDGGAIYPTGVVIDDYISSSVVGVKSTSPVICLNNNAFLTLGDNCTITNNYNSNSSDLSKRGGAINLSGSSNLYMSSNSSVIEKNYGSVGGGIFAAGSTSSSSIYPTIVIGKGKIQSNASRNLGGGICLMNSAHLSITDNILQSDRVQICNNEARQGGGIYAIGTNSSIKTLIEIFNTDFYQNGARNFSTIIDDTVGGGLFIDSNCEVSMTNTNIYENISMFHGAGLIIQHSKINLTDCTINSNTLIGNNDSTEISGSGIWALNSPVVFKGATKLYNNKFETLDGTSFNGNGSGIYLTTSSPLDFFDNSYIDLLNDIYLRSTDCIINVSYDYTLPSGIDKIACITPYAYPSMGNQLKVLSLSNLSTYTEDNKRIAGYFTVSKNDAKPLVTYTVGSNGYISSNEYSSENSIEIPTLQNVSFSVDKTSVYNDTQNSITVSTLLDGSDISDSENLDLDIKVLSGGVELPSAAGVSVIDNIVTFPENIAPGTYQLVVQCSYNNFDYESTILIQISKKNISSSDSSSSISPDDSIFSSVVAEQNLICNVNLDDSSELLNYLNDFKSANSSVQSVSLQLNNANDTNIENILTQINTARDVGIKIVLDLRNSSITSFPAGLTYVEHVIAIYFPNTLQTVANQAFAGCQGLTSLVIPDSVTSIGASAFTGCLNLQVVYLSSQIEAIPMALFENCSSLEKVNIPVNVSYIERQAFRGCEALNEVYFDNPDNWFAGNSIDDVNEIALDTSDIENNASLVNNVYVNHLIYRK